MEKLDLIIIGRKELGSKIEGYFIQKYGPNAFSFLTIDCEQNELFLAVYGCNPGLSRDFCENGHDRFNATNFTPELLGLLGEIFRFSDVRVVVPGSDKIFIIGMFVPAGRKSEPNTAAVVVAEGPIYSFEMVQGNVRVRLVRLGEGHSGDFNPSDPDDEELLRFDVSVRSQNGRWVDPGDASYCTRLPASITKEQWQKALQIIVDEVYGPASRGESIKRLCERMSWLGPEDLERAVVHVG